LYFNNGYIWFNSSYNKKVKTTLKFKVHSKKTNKPLPAYRNVEIYDIDKSKIDNRKSNNALIPNLFHNIDSGICCNILSKFVNYNKPILSVHDAYVVKCQDVNILLYEYNTELFKLIYTINNIELNNNISINVDLKVKLQNRIDCIESIKQSIVESKYTLKHEYE
jgi:hypothetical protein